MATVKQASIVYLDDKTYNVIDIRSGGMGRVWLLENAFYDSFDPIYRPLLAVKTFDFTPKQFAIRQELDNWVALDHKHILPLIKIGHLNYKLAAIMPWQPGTLDDMLTTSITMSERDVIQIASQIAQGLKHAYETGRVVHLDLKPANILITMQEPIHVQISDWGISRIAAQIAEASWANWETSKQHTAYGAGTLFYMAPERFSGNWEIRPQADMYSLGIMLVQLLTGTLPFRVDERNPRAEIALGTYIENARKTLRVKSPKLNELIFACISPDSKNRPKTYSDIISTLRRA